MLVICTCGFVVLIAVVLKEFLEESMPHVVQGVMRDLRATKIMQYLPLSKEDWERFDVETDEDAIRVLRNLVKSVGFYDCLENCYELHGEIIASYHAFLTMKYGEWDVIFDIDDDVLVDANDLVLCSDEDFDANRRCSACGAGGLLLF